MPYVIVTGATQGIGKAIAERLLSEGFSVAVCARTLTDLQTLANEWKKKFPEAIILSIQADLSKREEAKSFASKVLSIFPAIDILVNNAGLYFPGKLATEPEGHLEELMTVNMYSAYHITRAVLPRMLQQKSGHIFNMCSVASLKAYPNGGAYSITKYALLGFSENLRDELKNDNIKVTAICPGATHSRSWAGSNIPAERIMEAADTANMVWASYTLSKQANVELIVIRPQQGDL